MTYPYYPFEGSESALRFEFDSVSIQTGKIIRKRVEFSPTSNPNLYNLALGDVQTDGVIDIFSRSNNDDRDLILATVVQVIVAFLTHYPDRLILFTGSTESRTRLYRLAIARELDNASKLFDIYGIRLDQRLEPFKPDNEYIAFIIRNKVGTRYDSDET